MSRERGEGREWSVDRAPKTTAYFSHLKLISLGLLVLICLCDVRVCVCVCVSLLIKNRPLKILNDHLSDLVYRFY